MKMRSSNLLHWTWLRPWLDDALSPALVARPRERAAQGANDGQQ